MRDWFFYQERGKTMGPLTIEDVRARIRDGRIKLFDLIYKEGETSWKMAMEHPDLSQEFKNPANSELSDRPWVCLHRKSEESFEFITLGPYSTNELKSAIQSGKVSYSDYAWKSGFLEWKRLGAIQEFNARAATSGKAEASGKPETSGKAKTSAKVKASDAPTVAVPIRRAKEDLRESEPDDEFKFGGAAAKDDSTDDSDDRVDENEDLDVEKGDHTESSYRGVSSDTRGDNRTAPLMDDADTGESEIKPDASVPLEAIALLRNVVEFKRGGQLVSDVEPEPEEVSSEDLTKVIPVQRQAQPPRPPPPDVDPDATRIVAIRRPESSDTTKMVAIKTPQENFDPDATRVVKVDRRVAAGQPPPPPKAKFKGVDLTALNRAAQPSPVPAAAINPSAKATEKIQLNRSEISIRPGRGGGDTGAFRRENEEPEAEGKEPVLKKRRKKRRSDKMTMIWTDWGIVGSLIVILAVVTGLIVRRISKRSIPPPPPVLQSLEAQSSPNGGVISPAPVAPPSESLPRPEFGPPPKPKLSDNEAPSNHGSEDEDDDVPANGKKKPGTTIAKAAPAAPPQREPTQLVLNVQNSGGAQAKIEVRSNGSSEFPVFVQIVGLPGQVTDGPAFYRYIKLKTTGSSAKPLDMSGVHLPPGKYILRAETGHLHKESTMDLGVTEPSYRQAIARTRKTYSAAVWRERLDIYKSSLKLESAVTQALTSKHLSPKGLEGLSAVKKANGANYIFFEEWWELRQIFNEAREKPTTAQLERAKRIRSKIAGFTVWHK